MAPRTERIAEFIVALEQEFGETLTPDEAAYHLTRLTALYRALLRRLPSEDDSELLGDSGDIAGGT